MPNINSNFLSKDECKDVQMELLRVIDKICKENNLWYSLAYGSLLGAIRHKGFIPWDDDIDVVMFRDDYEKFISYVKSQKEIPWLSVIDGDTPGYYFCFAKVVHNKTIAKQNDTKVKHGLWIDIFPLDKTPIGDKESLSFLRKNKFLRDWILASVTDFRHVKLSVKSIVKLVLSVAGHIFGVRRLHEYTVRSNKKYEDTDSKYVACLSTPYVVNERFSVDDIGELVDVEFEHEYFKGIKNWDFYLKQIYGDYMQLPPVEKRRTHDLKVVWIGGGNIEK